MNYSWIIIALAGYLIMAMSQIIDKALLKSAFKEPKAYVFLTGFLGIIAFVLLPFGINIIPQSQLFWALFAGFMFVAALVPFLTALQGDDATRIIPLIGATIPIATLVGESLFLETTLSSKQYWAFGFLVLGGVILTLSRSESKRRSWMATSLAILGAILFAASFVATKYIFTKTTFINGFFWMRMGGLIAAAGLLFFEEVRRGLATFWKTTKPTSKIAYFSNQGLAGLGFILQNFAISLASVSLVNALQGVQYLFVIIVVAVASRFKPELLGEKITKRVVVEKLTAVVIVTVGIALLAL